MYFEGDNINDIYYKLIDAVYNKGIVLKKTDGTVLKEIVPSLIKIANPSNAIITHKHRPYNPAFMIAEMLWNLTGDNRQWLCFYNSKYKEYFVDNKLDAGYGNRIFNRYGNQFLKVANLLTKDKDSSHGTISIFDPINDLETSLFVPCISFIEFRIIDNKLNMFTRMRAQDLWKGFPYDINLLISYFKLMSKLIDIPMGDYYHDCRAIRVYEDDYDDIRVFLENKDNYEYSTPNYVDFECFSKKEIFEKLQFYRDIISQDLNPLEIGLDDESLYWKNALLSCYIYRLIRKEHFSYAKEYLENLSFQFKKQFYLWSKRYYNSFYEEFLNETEKNI